MQKTILLVLVLSLFSLFFQQAFANDVRFCLPTTDASAVQTAPAGSATAAGNFAGFFSVAVNKAGTYLWAIYNQTVWRYQIDTTTGNVISTSRIKIGVRKVDGTGACVAQRRSICDPFGVYVDPLDRLWVADNGLRRVLQWNNASLTVFSGIVERPVKVIGAPDFFTTNSQGFASAFNLTGPQGVAYYEETDTLWVLDSNEFGATPGSAARALRYDLISAQPSGGVSAQAVLGQADFTGYASSSSVSGSRLGNSFDLVVDQTNGDLYIADTLNERVLLFTSAQGKSSGSSANRVIGQSSTSKRDSATSNKGLWAPSGLWLDTTGNQLFISDQNNSRVVVLADVSSLNSNGPQFDTVIGQASFDAGSANQGGAAPALNTLWSPGDVAFNDVTGYIYVADSANRRLTVYGPCLTDKPTPGITPSPASISASVVVAASTSITKTTFASPDPSISISASQVTASVSPTAVFFTTTGGSGSTGSTGRVTTGSTGARRH